jgi:hypothetical protein
MSEHILTKAKNEYAKTHGLSDQPLKLEVVCTLGVKTLEKIQNEGGKVVKFSDMFDEYASIKEDLERLISFYYVPVEAQKYDFKFLLNHLDISDIQCPDNNNSLVLGGSLAIPELHGLSFPTDHGDGKFKKIFDLNEPRRYISGRPCAFIHALKHSMTDSKYNIIKATADVNPKILLPGDTFVKQPGPPMLYSHLINNDTLYKGSDYPTIVQYLRSQGQDSLLRDYRVTIPESSYLRQWHKNKENFDTETGCDIPLDIHVKSSYMFLDNLNHHRATTFDRSGIFWDVQQMKSCPIKFKLSFDITPIVPICENKETIPHMNFKRSLRCQYHMTEKPF